MMIIKTIECAMLVESQNGKKLNVMSSILRMDIYIYNSHNLTIAADAQIHLEVFVMIGFRKIVHMLAVKQLMAQ